MKCFLVLGLLVAAAYSDSPKPRLAINYERYRQNFGGQNAGITEVPYQVAMLLNIKDTFTQICGGSIIRADIILSAAHCAFESSPDMWRVRAASTSSHSGGQLMEVWKILIHGQFNKKTLDYDIALYFLSAKIQLGEAAAIIKLPAQGESDANGAIAIISGWGLTEEGGEPVEFLQKVDVPIINQQECVTAYEKFNPITDRMLCAGDSEADACSGDSGGPLVVNEVLYGVSSWGAGCGNSSYPGVYVRVSTFVNWIEQNW